MDRYGRYISKEKFRNHPDFDVSTGLLESYHIMDERHLKWTSQIMGFECGRISNIISGRPEWYKEETIFEGDIDNVIKIKAEFNRRYL